jgi:hypothetical protein
MRRVPILIGRRRWFRLSMRVTGHDADGFPRFAGEVRGYRCRAFTARQRTLQRRREATCAHAHLSGGGQGYDGEWNDWMCDDCGAICPDVSSRARVIASQPETV